MSCPRPGCEPTSTFQFYGVFCVSVIEPNTGHHFLATEARRADKRKKRHWKGALGVLAVWPLGTLAERAAVAREQPPGSTDSRGGDTITFRLTATLKAPNRPGLGIVGRTCACSLMQPSRPPCRGDAFRLDNDEGDVEPNRAGVGQDRAALLCYSLWVAYFDSRTPNPYNILAMEAYGQINAAPPGKNASSTASRAGQTGLRALRSIRRHPAPLGPARAH